MMTTGAPTRPAGNPSPRGTEEGRRRSFHDEMAGVLPKPPGAPSPRTVEEGRQADIAAARIDEYAAFFVDQMIASMRATTFRSGLMDGGRAEEIFQSHLDGTLSKQIAGSLRFSKAFGKALERLGSPDHRAVEGSSHVA